MYSEQDKIKTWLTNNDIIHLNHHDIKTGWTGLLIVKPTNQFKGVYLRGDALKKSYTPKDRLFYESSLKEGFLAAAITTCDMAIKYLKMIYRMK